MTIKFFPLWLYDSVLLTPLQFNVVQAIMPLCVAGGTILFQALSTHIGASPVACAPAALLHLVTAWVPASSRCCSAGASAALEVLGCACPVGAQAG